MFGFFPPSSSDTFLNIGAHVSATLRPVTVPPVNEIVPIFGCAVIGRADIWPGAVHDVEHAVRQAGFATNLAQQVGRHRRQLARLGDGGVAARDGGRDFPAQQIERQIPGRDQSGDAARLAQRVIEGDAIGDVRFVLRVQDRRREEAEIAEAARGMSRLRASESGLPVSIDSARASFSRSRSIRSAMRRRMRDRSAAGVRDQLGERFLRRGDGQFDIATVAVRDLRIRLARRRLDVVEIFAADRLDELAVDEVLNLFECCHTRALQ